MNTANDHTRLTDDLTAHWTDAGLEILHAAGVGVITVDMELDLWKNLKNLLRAEIGWQRALRFSTRVSLATLREEVLHKVALLAVRKSAEQGVSYAFEQCLRNLVREQRPTDAELRLYAELVREPAFSGAFKPPTRTDYFPRLRAMSAG